MTTNQEKLQELFDAALRSLDEPEKKPVSQSRENMFPPPPWRTQEEAPAVPRVLPQLKTET